ncbi:MAG: SpoIIE family protein phosphatase [Jatrophihabitantaceae bacterium]
MQRFAEDARAELARFEALVEYAPDAIVILDLDAGHFVTVNRAAEALFGMGRADLLQVGPVDVSPPVQPDGRPSQSAAMAYLDRALAGEQPRFEWTHRRADGIDIPCEITLLRLPDPVRRLIRGSVLDVTERRATDAARAAAAAERAARLAAERSVARLQATMAGLNAIVWERDPVTLRLTFVNQRAEELLGYPASQWLAEDGLWERILYPDDRDDVLTRIGTALGDGTVDFALTYRVRAADGRWVWLQHLGHVDRDPSGTAHTLHAVLFDVTEVRRRERAASLLAAAAEALTALGGVEDRLAAVTELLAGEFGDWAAVWLAGDDGGFRPVAVAPAALAGQVLDLLLWPPEDLAAQIRAGRAFVVPEVIDALRRAADRDQYAALAGLGADRWLVAPLTTGGKVVGLLTVAADARPAYDAGDIALADDLGQRIATMVAGERLAAQQRQLHGLAVALAAAATAAEAGAALTAALAEVLAASVAAVYTLGEDRRLHVVDVHGYSPGWAEFGTIGLSEPVPLAEAARTRRPVWLPDRAALLSRSPQVAPFLQAQIEASASLPLLVGHRLVGALAVVFPRPRAFDAAERTFLLTVAGQVAAALERAALADVRREMADTLQRNLLPARLPTTEQVTVAARYIPAIEGTLAGGDWYDADLVTDDCLALTVGDVVGHGTAAAAVMGRLSSALSAFLVAGHRPARALELLDRLAAQIEGARLATAACLLLNPATGRLTYSTAGHPPPLLALPDGRVSWLDEGHGPALAVLGAAHRREAVVTVPAGATLLLYTDGLIERRDSSLDDGLDRLAAAAGRHQDAPPTDFIDRLLTDLLDGGGTDDVALLAIQRPNPRG